MNSAHTEVQVGFGPKHRIPWVWVGSVTSLFGSGGYKQRNASQLWHGLLTVDLRKSSLVSSWCLGRMNRECPQNTTVNDWTSSSLCSHQLCQPGRCRMTDSVECTTRPTRVTGRVCPVSPLCLTSVRRRLMTPGEPSHWVRACAYTLQEHLTCRLPPCIYRGVMACGWFK